MFEAVLMADGVPPDEVYDVLSTGAGVERVLNRLATIRSDVVWWTSGAQAPQLLADGEVAIAELRGKPWRAADLRSADSARTLASAAAAAGLYDHNALLAMQLVAAGLAAEETE